MSYRTRRSRDPWFDRLTTLSEVEGVSRKSSSALDSGQSLRDFRNDEIRARDEKIATYITVLAKGKPTAICGPGVLFFQPLPLVTLLTRALLIVTSLVAWENRWILFTHLHTLLLPIWIKSIHSGGRRQGQQLGNQDGISQNYCKIN